MDHLHTSKGIPPFEGDEKDSFYNNQEAKSQKMDQPHTSKIYVLNTNLFGLRVFLVNILG